MELEEYGDLKEKEAFFVNGSSKVNVNLDLIFEKISEFQNEGDTFIYRGVSEAKRKLYNSAQRLYMGQDLHLQVPEDHISDHYKKFIDQLIESAKNWNNGAIKNLLLNSDIMENNALAYLSFMQHYGVPTPFLDYSSDPYVALFFAIDNASYRPSNREIDNYFSFYYTYSNKSRFKLLNPIEGLGTPS
jgi:hypothetical protein